MREYFIWLAKLVTFAMVVIFGFFMVVAVSMGAVASSKGKLTSAGEQGVALIELTGVITSSTEILRKLDQHLTDDNIIGVVLDIDSPGGAIAPSQAIYRAVERFKAKKPIVATMNSVAASGGLYAAIGASKILSQPGTLTGSIGVVLQLPNIEELSKKIGVDMVTIKAGELKDAGNAFREMSERDRSYFQATADKAHQEFIQDVAESRGLELETVRTFSDGRILLGSEAKDLGLVDDYGDMFQAARIVYQLADKPLAEDESPNILFTEEGFNEIINLLKSAINIPAKVLSPMRIDA